MGAKAATGLSARERLLEAANELFYAEGVHTVGIDRVIERAGVAKASLYNTFGSKDELVRAYLQGRHARCRGADHPVRRAVRRPRRQAARRVRGAGRAVRRAGVPRLRVRQRQRRIAGRGGSRAADDYRGWVRGPVTGLARDAGAPEPERAGRQLHMVYDGASLSAGWTWTRRRR